MTYVPGETWISTTPEEQNMSSVVLNDLIQFINESEARVDGLVVTRNGYIVTEQYWRTYNENRSHHIFSCTKSFTSALIGIAIKEGFIDNVSQRMLDFFPEYTIENPSEVKNSITIEHLLTMTHGLDWNEHNISYTDSSNMYNQMFYSGDPIKFFLDLPSIHPPGEEWVYTTGASHLLSAIVQRATSMTTREFAETYLFEPMNAEISMWNVYNGVNHGGTQLYITPRDFTKFGLLYLNNGTWGNQQILSEEWVIDSTTPYIELWQNTSYGYQWWIDDNYDGYMALGSEMQTLYVNPELGLVVTMTATVRDQNDISTEIIQRVLQSVSEFEPTVGVTPDFTQLLMILGLVSISAIILVLGVRFVKKGAS
jgi:CubicO group peptidase (beta-lactamase class C family)